MVTVMTSQLQNWRVGENNHSDVGFRLDWPSFNYWLARYGMPYVEVFTEKP